MKLDGQLENAQLQELASTNPSPTARSRIYSDISDVSNPIPKMHDGSRWCAFKLRKGYSQSLSADTTLTQVDERVFVNATGGAKTITLPAASAMSGEELYIQKTDTSFNAVAVTRAGADTIDGATALNLNTYGEWVLLRSTGTGWVTLDWGYFEGKVAFTPTGLFVANTTYTGYWFRRGNTIHVEWYLAFAGAPTATFLAVNLPSGVTIDTAKLLSTTGKLPLPSSGGLYDLSATTTYVLYAAYNSTTSVLVHYDSGTGTMIALSNTAPVTIANGDYMSVSVASIPVSGWRGFWAV